ncbi:hypothetical protein CYMTET_3527 [Cymbomonas tetramitiformis]|uniref:Uncharacterized protein n=1 Tax=Cymbomonas tetramitiformis TaxID=36881 RepID=A0AAE0H3G6_9CHLO|nr:hypothetical protein CYMTET_3527 [Cymbomonas tetramitiformis]
MVAPHQLPRLKNRPFSHTIFFHIELLVQTFRLSFVDPLELFIYSLPEHSNELGKEGDDGLQASEEEQIKKGRASSRRVPLRRFKVEFNKFCIQHGMQPSGNIQDKKQILKMAGLSIVKSATAQDSFVCLGWRALSAEALDKLAEEAARTNDCHKDTVTMFLQAQCVFTGLDSDAISVQTRSPKFSQNEVK